MLRVCVCVCVFFVCACIQYCGPSPCTYVLKSSVDVLLGKRTGVRGPYDLFTGQRDAPVTSGFFAVPVKKPLTHKHAQHAHTGMHARARTHTL